MNDIRVHAVESINLVSKDGLEKLISILRTSGEAHQVVVLAPFTGAELELTSLLQLAMQRDERLWSMQEQRFTQWTTLVEDILSVPAGTKVLDRIKQGFSDLEDILRSIWLIQEINEGAKRYAGALCDSWIADLACHWANLQALPSSLLGYSATKQKQTVAEAVLFVYGAAKEGHCEYAAASLAAQLHATGVTFWNNSSLLHNTDHREVPSALVIRSLSYAEATELSFFGAPIIHSHALVPAIAASLDVQLRCWKEEQDPGTIISKDGDQKEPNRVKGFSIIHDIALINIEGAGMSGVIGIASRLFSAMREASISVILISQASSEYSICFAVPEHEAERACDTASREFAPELEARSIQSIAGEKGLAVLAAVGQQMTGQAGVAGKFFSSLGKAGVNVIAIAQGSSETNISAVIKGSD
ncbi:MAG: ACT domain-containing protein, partial [Sphaerochaetaceae bacterium]